MILRNIRTRYRFLFIAALIVFASPVSAQDEGEVIKIDSATVVINATVFDRDGKVVGGIGREQFSVYENGTRQEISFFSAADTPFAAVILIDSSGSMETRISMARAAAINFLDGIRVNDNVAIYRFASKVELVQDFSGSRDISEKIFDIRADGMTALNDSIFKAAEELKNRDEKRRAIVVLSDGEDTFSGRSADRALKAALEAGALIYTIDMSAINDNSRRRMQNQGVLKNLAEKSGGRFISTPAGAALRQAFTTIVEELGVQYTLGYEPADQKKDGKWRAIEVRIARPNLTIRARKGYTAAK